MPQPQFDKSIFINCPFDDEYAPILQAIAFCVIDLGFTPRIAPENPDNGVARMDRILELIRQSKYGIHDLSRCRAKKAGEYSRFNMPFELGLDYACAKYGSGEQRNKVILVLEERRYDTQRALSDIAGWDIESHNGSHETAIRKTRNWLARVGGIDPIGTSRIVLHYAEFWEWYFERELANGASEDDIKEYPTIHVIDAMRQWKATQNN